jgi:hypothetical protein
MLDVLFTVHDLGVKVERLIKDFDLGKAFFKNVLLVVTEPLEEGNRCSSLEEIEDTVPLREGVGGSSLGERVFTIGAAASAKSL